MSFGALSAQRRRGAQPRRRAGGLPAEHRRGRHLAATTATAATWSSRSAPRLLRLPRRARPLRPRPLHGHGRRRAPVRALEIKLSQGAKPGLGGLLPGAKVIGGDRRDPRRPARARTASARRGTRRSPTSTSCSTSSRCSPTRPGCPVGIKSAVGELDVLGRARRADGRHRARASTSSPSTAARAAPARRRWCSPTTSRCRSSTASAGSTRSFAEAGLHERVVFVGLRQARPAGERRRRLRARRGHGQRRAARRCCRSAASRPSTATPTAARPA